jgi:hypothetical protein
MDGGGTLYRVKDDRCFAVTGTKGFKWIEAETTAIREAKGELNVDLAYFDGLRQAAFEAIDYYTHFEEFVS